ncbi:hypothetical protein E4U40_003297 [Claviceps sp. LM458 group G5]|nr:hypothetical protein E4U40_003297 [Claviceps sp. LM458 group G5]
MHALSLLALLLPLVAAKTHKQCGCRTYTADKGWETNIVLARWASWDDKAQRCAERTDKIDGQTFEDQCKFFGTQGGYYPITAQGYPDKSGKPLMVDIALGQCFD